jgi:hypothetical protein
MAVVKAFGRSLADAVNYTYRLYLEYCLFGALHDLVKQQSPHKRKAGVNFVARLVAESAEEAIATSPKDTTSNDSIESPAAGNSEEDDRETVTPPVINSTFMNMHHRMQRRNWIVLRMLHALKIYNQEICTYTVVWSGRYLWDDFKPKEIAMKVSSHKQQKYYATSVRILDFECSDVVSDSLNLSRLDFLSLEILALHEEHHGIKSYQEQLLWAGVSLQVTQKEMRTWMDTGEAELVVLLPDT